MNNQPNPSTPPAEPIIVSARQSQNQSITKNDEQYLQEPTLLFLNHIKIIYVHLIHQVYLFYHYQDYN